jgi:hypothetical protein
MKAAASRIAGISEEFEEEFTAAVG